MAIVQISRITQRKGLQENLPQLSGGELGWSVDQRRLYIGNGTLQEGAPAIGNTEILTEFSNILESSASYTYQGAAAGYTVQTGETSGAPVTQSLQSRLDSYAVVTDFGAVGDGVTDDTDAINRALYQMFCRQRNPQIRRSLFFPAGVYLVKESILIPPFATLYGEGAFGSVIKLDVASDTSTLNAYVARTADSNQQFGSNIGVGGALPPQSITISNMGFQTLQETDVFLVDQATSVTFQNVSFIGNRSVTDLAAPVTRGDIAGLRFNSSTNLVTNDVTVNNCTFSYTTYGISTPEQIRTVHVTNSDFYILYQGVIWGGTGVDPMVGGPTGCAVTHCQFDAVYDSGIVIDGVSKNMSGYNMFYDVGNHFGGVDGTPYAAVILITDSNNVSLGDMFSRSDGAALTSPRIDLVNTTSIAIDNGQTLMMGSYRRSSGVTFTLLGNATNATLFTINTSQSTSFTLNYSITRGSAVRNGAFTVISTSGPATSDDYLESAAVQVTLSATVVGSTITVLYTTVGATTATMTYSLVRLA